MPGSAQPMLRPALDLARRGLAVSRDHVIVLLVLAFAVLSTGQDRLASLLTDWTFRVLQRPATGEVVLVAIDPGSIRDVGTWPWPRRVYGEVADRLREAGASDIAFDVDFSTASRPEEDDAFAAALARAGGSVILPVFKQNQLHRNERSAYVVNRPIPQLAAESWLASVNVTPDGDGRFRRYRNDETIGSETFPSFARALAGGAFDRGTDFRIDYGIDFRTLPVISAADVLHRRVDPARITGRKVIVGGTAIELGDRHNVPARGVIAGFEIQALAAESVLQNRTLQPTGTGPTVAGLFVLALLFAALRRRLNVRAATTALAAAAAGIELVALLAQALAPVIVDTSFWLLAAASYIAMLWLDEVDLRTVIARLATQRFEDVARGIKDGVLYLDAEGAITFCNPAAALIFEEEERALLGRPIGDIIAAGQDFAAFVAASRAMAPAEGAASVTIEFDGIRRSGTAFPLELSLTERGEQHKRVYNLILRDICLRKQQAERLRIAALTDPLTGMANRLAFQERLAQLTPDSSACFRIVLLDLDGFKEINDAFGHDTGDRILCEFSAALADLVGAQDLVARIGGDEYAVVIVGEDCEERTSMFTEAVAQRFNSTYFRIANRSLRLGASIGHAGFPADGPSSDDVFSNADLALYASKEKGGETVRFESRMRAEREAGRQLLSELRRACKNGEFELFYQPQVDLRTGRVAGAEALIRWRHPARGLLPPGAFMEAVHSSDISDTVANWVLEDACRQAAVWERAGVALRVGVNLSPSQMRLDIAGLVAGALARSGASPALIDLEVTENILLADEEAIVGVLGQIRELGVSLAFDDFGTGFASLTHLKTMPIDRIKIDRSFVQNLTRDSQGAVIVQSIIHMAHALDLKVIAEGIEDADVMAMLKLIGCDEGQGYLFGRPMPAEDVAKLAMEGAVGNRSGFDGAAGATVEALTPARAGVRAQAAS